MCVVLCICLARVPFILMSLFSAVLLSPIYHFLYAWRKLSHMLEQPPTLGQLLVEMQNERKTHSNAAHFSTGKTLLHYAYTIKWVFSFKGTHNILFFFSLSLNDSLVFLSVFFWMSSLFVCVCVLFCWFFLAFYFLFCLLCPLHSETVCERRIRLYVHCAQHTQHRSRNAQPHMAAKLCTKTGLVSEWECNAPKHGRKWFKQAKHTRGMK